MKIHAYLTVALLGAALTITTSCSKEEGCTDETATNYNADAEKDDGSCTYPTEGTLMLHLHPKVGDASFAVGTEYTDDFGTKYTFERAQFYLTIAQANGDASTAVNSYLILDGTVDGHQMVGMLPNGTYTGLDLGIGLPEAVNHEDPVLYDSENVLSPQNPSMHWSWTAGYKFVVLEGTFDSDGDGSLDDSFVFHIGSDDLYRTFTLAEPFSITGGNETTIHLDVNFGAMMHGVDIASDPSTHTMDNIPLAMTIADNSVMVFSGHN